MASFRSAAAVAALALVSNVVATHVDYPACTSEFRPFVYAGCFSDEGSQDAMTFRSTLDTQTMTVEKCQAECKGNGYKYAGIGTFRSHENSSFMLSEN